MNQITALSLIDFPQLSHINPIKKYAYAVEAEKLLWLKKKKYIVAPFPIGQGRTQLNFRKRLKIASGLIVSILPKIQWK